MSQRPESKTEEKAGKRHAQSDERSPRFTNVLGTFVDMQNHTQNSSTLHKGSKNSWKQLRAQSKHLRVFSDTSYTNYKHMETLKGIFQCPQKLTNVIQTSQNSPWLSLRSLNKWYGVFAPQYYKFSHCSHPQNARLPMSLSSVGMTTSCFFPRVRTPCGHGAQVIVEGREEQSDGGEKDKDNQTNKKQPQNTAHRPSLHHLVVFPLC